jgi:glycosyltransferase involved in cell wall biosynthesis
MNVYVSIITPYYNTGVIFTETIESVLAQTLTRWEWAIVNDGSTDQEALSVLDKLRQLNDPRIQIIDQPNRGLPAARNAGVAATHAPLLFFLDSDDLLAPTALERLVDLLERDPHIACATTWIQAFGAKSFMWRRGFDSGNLFLFENTVTALSMVRRSVFDAVDGFNESRTGGLEDYEFWIRCAALGFWGRDIPEPLIFQRYKSPQEYVHYTWALRDDIKQFRAFQREMRVCYPQLYQQGVPCIPASHSTLSKPAFSQRVHTYARDRLALWAFPLTLKLRAIRLRFVESGLWRSIGPLWRRVRRLLRAQRHTT